MSLEKLAKECIKSIHDTPLEIAPSITLIMKGKWGSSNKKYFAGKGSPKGSIVQETNEGLFVIFDAVELLAWCVAKGVKVQVIQKRGQ